MSSQANNGLTHDDNFRIKVEFAVNVSTEDDFEKIRKALGSRVSDNNPRTYDLPPERHN